MWAIIPWLRVARTIATFGWLFSACCLLLVRLTMLELPLNFPTMSLWMVLKPPSRHSDFPRDFSNPNEFLFRWRMHADMWPQTWRHKASDMFDSKVCSAGELFESFFADEASLTFAPTESWQSSGASHIWCSSCCTSWGCAIDLGRQTAQTVPKSDDLWWFCRKSFCLRRFFQNKKMFQLLMVDLSLPNPDPNLASGPFELPGSLLFSKTCVCVCVSFWSKNAGINDKNLGPYVSVLQRKWHCTIASKSHHRISQKFHVHGSMPSHAIIWIVHNNANITSGSSEYAHIYPVCLLFLETVATFQRSGSLWHGQVGNSPFGPGSRQACRQLWRVQQCSPSQSRGEWPFGLQVISLNFESEGFVWRKKALLSEIRIRFFFGQKIWNSSLCRFLSFSSSKLLFPLPSRTCCVCRASRRCWGVLSGTSSSVWPSCGTPSSPTASKRRNFWVVKHGETSETAASFCSYTRLHWASFSVQHPQRLRCSDCMPQIEMIRIFGRTLSKLVQVEKSRERSHGSMKVLDQCYKVPRCHSKVSKMLPLSTQKRPIRGALVVPVAQPWTPRHVAALSASGQGGQELWRFSSCA